MKITSVDVLKCKGKCSVETDVFYTINVRVNTDAGISGFGEAGVSYGVGADAAIEAADIVLMDDDPAKIAQGVRHARRTMRIVHQNIIFALAVKLLVMVLGICGFANMWLAVFADVGVAMLAILNAMRAMKMK